MVRSRDNLKFIIELLYSFPELLSSGVEAAAMFMDSSFMEHLAATLRATTTGISNLDKWLQGISTSLEVSTMQ